MRLFFFSSAIYFLSFSVFSSTSLIGSLKGDDFTWSNGRFIDKNIVQQTEWDTAERFNMLPASQLRGAVVNNGDKISVTFKNDKTGENVTTSVKTPGISFMSDLSFSDYVFEPSYVPCSVDEITGSSIHVLDSKRCSSSYLINLDRTLAKEPFKFFKHDIDISDVAGAFKSARVSEGIYSATFPVKLGYFYRVSTSGVMSYNIFTSSIKLILKYKPSFIDNVSVIGDGVFDTKYDTLMHTVEGQTRYVVNVSGHIDPGIKMSIKSNNKLDDFYLVNNKTGDSIAYSILCRLCTRKDIVVDGNANDKGEYYIPFVGDFLKFNLDFHFKPTSEKELSNGEYHDSIITLIQLDL
ncbi:TPA: hypothetical protein ACX6RR_000860 [Photobacterium damselae]